MEIGAEFELRGVLCSIVPEDTFLSGTEDCDAGYSPSVIGRCRLEGQRYLILRATGSEERDFVESVSALCQLTRREREVASLVGAGLGNKQIAHQLSLSEWTVSSYLRRVFAKLGVRTRAAMVARLFDS